jgi:phosphoglycolate phosphatase-like HAD superfamily hydrolase
MTQRKPTPNILAGPVNVLDDVLSGKAAGWPKEVDYPVERVIVGKRLRPVRDVTDLAESMDQIGLLNRITLLPDGTLVAGAHRLAAAKHLGWATIPARIVELDEVDSELAEIDENLRRTELTVLEQAEHLLRREELLAAKGVRAKAGDNQHTDATTTATIADSMGISERSAQQRLQIARGLSQEARDALRGTELAESTTKLVELSRQPQQYQVAIVRRMVDDGYLTVDAAASTVIPRKPEPDPALVAEGERKERERLAYMAENGRRNEEHWAKMREEMASAATGSRQQGAELARCSVCNRPLSDPASAIAGVGPCCAAKRTAATGEPTISLDELEVEDSVTVRMDTDGKPLMDWDDDDWAAYERKLKERQIVQTAPAAEPVRFVAPVAPTPTADLDILAPDRSEASSVAERRNERIDSILRRLYAAQSAVSEFEDMTGIYTHSPAFHRVMDAMIGTLEANRL